MSDLDSLSELIKDPGTEDVEEEKDLGDVVATSLTKREKRRQIRRLQKEKLRRRMSRPPGAAPAGPVRVGPEEMRRRGDERREAWYREAPDVPKLVLTGKGPVGDVTPVLVASHYRSKGHGQQCNFLVGPHKTQSAAKMEVFLAEYARQIEPREK
jgi:hypothetical protein